MDCIKKEYLIIITLFFGTLLASDSLKTKGAEEKLPGLIEVNITGINTTKAGGLIVNLYTEGSWNKPLKVFRQLKCNKGADSEMTVVFDSIPFPKEYAVQVVHDSDGNGKLTMKWLPPGPKEGAGVSNYVPTGIPKFQKAKFYYSGKKTAVTVEMAYPD